VVGHHVAVPDHHAGRVDALLDEQVELDQIKAEQKVNATAEVAANRPAAADGSL
jgi:hypothetical protein